MNRASMTRHITKTGKRVRATVLLRRTLHSRHGIPWFGGISKVWNFSLWSKKCDLYIRHPSP